MSNVYQIARLGMQFVQDRMEVVSENAAHATVPGYRRQIASTSGVSFEQIMNGQSVTAPNMVASRIAHSSRGIDLTTAGTVSTGRPLDAAILDKTGFFLLSDGQQVFLTRHGSFHIDPSGWLTGDHGLKVQGENGDIFVGNESVTIAESGRVMAGDRVVAHLSIKAPQTPSALKPDGRGLLVTEGSELTPVDSNLRVTHLEGSNTDSTKEMLTMMTSLRQYESLVRVVQNYDDMLGRTIQKLSEA